MTTASADPGAVSSWARSRRSIMRIAGSGARRRLASRASPQEPRAPIARETQGHGRTERLCHRDAVGGSFGEQRTEHNDHETDGETGDESREAVDEDHLLRRHRNQCCRVEYVS